MRHASLKKRVLAYVIDMFIVSFIISFISMGYSTSKIEELSLELDNVNSKYVNKEISNSEYVDSMLLINYDINKANVVRNTLYVVICIGYFVMFQYLNSGASIGMNIMGIRVIGNDRDIGPIGMFIRTFIFYDVMSSLFSIILLYLVNPNIYMICMGIINIICFIYIVISLFMIKFRKDNLAINDIMSRSCVIDVR